MPFVLSINFNVFFCKEKVNYFLAIIIDVEYCALMKTKRIESKVPKDPRGRKSLTDWDAMQIGESILATGGCSQYWNRKLAPKRFVKRGYRIYRSA